MSKSRGRLRVLSWVSLGLLLLVVAGAGAISLSDDVRWRGRILGAKLTGKLPEIPLTQLIEWLLPGSPIYLATLGETLNAHSGIRNDDMSPESGLAGGEMYGKHCASCHGASGEGGAGPDLVSSINAGLSDWSFLAAVKWGRQGTSMAAQPLSVRETWNVHTFLRQTALAKAGIKTRDALAALPKTSVSYEWIATASERPENWLTYAGNYAGHRHSSLAQINKGNVARLQLTWTAQLRAADAYLEASPIVYADRMFVTESPDGVVALRATDGKLLWRHRRPVPPNLPLCCGSPNRGAAVLGDLIYVATLDAHLVALDATTGKKRWEVMVADHRQGYSMTSAPLAIRGAIVVGVAGSQYGARGLVAAFSPDDGRLLWKFNAVPGPGEFGNETWGGESWKNGGASTWTMGAFDPNLDLVYWGVGSASPVFDADERPGDNLFSNSVLALDAKGGKLRWHYQFTPRDEHDWDATQQPVLIDAPWKGQDRKLLVWANRNGFFYVLDRATGDFLLAEPFAKQTWADGFDAKGRPRVLAASRPSPSGTLVWPWVGGATNWWPPSFDSKRGSLFVSTVDTGSYYFRGEASYEKGEPLPFLGGSTRRAPVPVTTSIKAIDVATGRPRWEALLAHGGIETDRGIGGILSTDGGVLFTGYAEEFLALDSDTGRVLWRVRLGGRINAAPVSFAISGRQHIAIMAGRSLFVFALPPD